jgi:hypothetical protein
MESLLTTDFRPVDVVKWIESRVATIDRTPRERDRARMPKEQVVMFRISKAAMDTSLERIRAKIAELEAKIADLRIAEREIRALEKLPSRRTRPGSGPKPKRKPAASNQAEARQTIGSAIADVLGQQGALSAAVRGGAIVGHGAAA